VIPSPKLKPPIDRRGCISVDELTVRSRVRDGFTVLSFSGFANLLKRAALPLLLVVLLAAHSAAIASAPRSETVLSADWRFIRADVPDAQSPSFDDSKWTAVTVPHTFNAADGEQPDYYRGPAWYRRPFYVRELSKTRRLVVQFDAVATRADVYVNGKFIGRHDGGYSRFRFDITDAIVPGRNVLAVRADNSRNLSITPLGGDFTVFGGIYRPVSFIEVDQLHFDLSHFGGPGVYARTNAIENDRAQVLVDARIANSGKDKAVIPLSITIRDSRERVVAVGSCRVNVPGSSVETATVQLTVAHPELWDGFRDPALYKVVARLGDDGDEVTVPLGIRQFRFDPQQGLILNGRHYAVHGVDLMNSERPEKGTAVTNAEVDQDFSIVREMGTTGVRLVHFQHPQEAYDEADRLGLVAWAELGVNGVIEDTPEFRANASQQLKELIFQNYNHPSILMWGLGNEIYSTDPQVAQFLSDLNRAAKELDPTRATVYAHCCQADNDPKAMVTDLIGFNKYFGWYPEQKGTIGDWAARVHQAEPTRLIAVSEYGAGGSILQQEDPPKRPVADGPWHPEQYQALFHERSWRDLKDKSYLWGTFVWAAFDLPSAGRDEGDRPGINDKGLVTYDRATRKDAYYWYKANWSNEPTLHITSKRFDRRYDPNVDVKVYSNVGNAALILNGRVKGVAEEHDHIVRWQLKLQPGANLVEVHSLDGREQDSAEWFYDSGPSVLDRRSSARPSAN